MHDARISTASRTASATSIQMLASRAPSHLYTVIRTIIAELDREGRDRPPAARIELPSHNADRRPVAPCDRRSSHLISCGVETNIARMLFLRADTATAKFRYALAPLDDLHCFVEYDSWGAYGRVLGADLICTTSREIAPSLPIIAMRIFQHRNGGTDPRPGCRLV